jgi:hypothetical protein
VYGGLALVLDPSGQALQMPVEYLRDSPFADYFIPGLILLVVNGVGSLVVAVLAILKARSYPMGVTVIGVALTIWIVVQMLLIEARHPLQYILGGVGVGLLILGLLKQSRQLSKQ